MLAYRLTDPLSRRTIAVSAAAAWRFVALGAIPRRKCSVIPNGFDVADFIPHRERRDQLRTEMRAETGVQLAADDDNFVWLAIGRVAPAKDYPNLVQAFAIVANQHRASRLLIAGDGRDRDLAELEAELRKLGIQDAARCIGPRRDIAALLDAADAFVLSSAWKGMPLVVGEAMAMEKPVVATDVGGVRELVGDAGLVVPSKNSSALAEAMIATMQQSREERAARGRSARVRIVSHFSIDASADAWEALYRSLAASSEQGIGNKE